MGVALRDALPLASGARFSDRASGRRVRLRDQELPQERGGALREAPERGLVRQIRRERRHRAGGRARVRGRDETADPRGRRREHRRLVLQDVRVRQRDPSSSVVTEWVKGQHVDEAVTIKNSEIAKHLDLPPVKLHCSMLAEDAIKAAVEDLKKKKAASA